MKILVVILSGLLIAVADTLLKKAALNGDFIESVKNPYTLFAVFLYLIQIGTFMYLFIHKWDLVIAGIMYTAVYTILTLLIGIFLFKEVLTLSSALGILLILSGIVLIEIQN